MLLTISTTHEPATDLGYLLHKHPDRVQRYELGFGDVHVFYPEAAAARCTAALLLDVDPVGLVRARGGGRSLDQYVNDRPYVASSFLSVAIARVLGSALRGRCEEREELVGTAIPLTARLCAVPCPGEEMVARLFGPLGYRVEVERHALDGAFPEWGEGRYATVTLEGTVRLQDLLSHLYVLVPVLDNDKHYWVGSDEVEKLLRHGSGWLGAHPEREMIAWRYLNRQGRLTRDAMARLAEEDEPDPDAAAEGREREEEAIERPLSLNQQRIGTVVSSLKAAGAKRVLDLGCGEGTLIRELLRERSVEEVVGVDVSVRALEVASERLRLERMPEAQRRRVTLLHGSLMYRDERLEGYDAAALVEVIEHLDPPRLAAMERTVFAFARPATVIVTTPNVEYNVKWETLPAGRMRHRDHRFEWTRAEFGAWAERVAAEHGYAVRYVDVGEPDPEVGPPTQMGVFTR